MSPNSLKAQYLSAAEDLQRNERQRDAYESTGHCLVLAGPGSGKTKVLTTKMARILAEDILTPRGVACITYSNQCVKELRKRLATLGVDESDRVFIGTVHSFCLRAVLMPYGNLADANIPDPIQVVTQSEQEELFKQAVETVLGDEKPEYVRTRFDEFRRTVLDRNSEEWNGNESYASLVMEYEQLLKDVGKIDFDGMALEGLCLIREHAWIRKALKAKYPVLMVDEYQDLGVPLHQIVMQLCFEAGVRLFAVGDPDQSIYGFNGARPILMNELANRTDVEDIRLRLNYRCGKTIIAASTAALAEARDFESAKDHMGIVQGYTCPNGFNEQVRIATRGIVPAALARKEGRRLGEIGILYMSQYDGAIIAGAVEQAGLEYVRFDQGNPYQRTPLISWFEDCASWCAGGWMEGEPRLSQLLYRWIRFIPSVTKESEQRNLRNLLVKFLFKNRSSEQPLRDWFAAFIALGLHRALRSEPTMVDEYEQLRLLGTLCCKNQTLERYTVAHFGGQRCSPDRINLTTIHSAKGLEYDVVIILGLEQGKIPYDNATPEKILEARRLFYVAMTRAKHEVHLLWSGWYENKYGRRFTKGRSVFVKEVMESLQEED